MEVVGRKLHRDQIAREPHLREQQQITWEKFGFGNDVEIYDDRGNLVAITARDNPNLSEVLANLRDQYDAPGGTR